MELKDELKELKEKIEKDYTEKVTKTETDLSKEFNSKLTLLK